MKCRGRYGALAIWLLSAVLSLGWGLPSFAQTHCPIEGKSKSGGRLPEAKKELNRLKNRTEFPTDLQHWNVGDILAIDDSRDTRLEQQGVVLDGFLLNFKHEGPESPNCYSQTRRDFHMWIGARPGSSNANANLLRSQSVVVEPPPLMQDQHATWIKDNFKNIKGKRIRVTGWLMFDPEHPDQLGKTRGTLWEVHPVMKIEMLQGGGWVEF
jgi:hypothetical protein